MSTLHITNGDVVADKLRLGFDGPVSITADILYEGPATELDGPAWHNQRGRYLAAAGYSTGDEARQTLAAWDDQIARAGEHGEVVLWFEHDLFDQLLLVRTLDLIDRLRGAARPARVSLICINSFLGQLNAPQLRGLWPTRAPVTGVQYAAARRVWHAYRQSDPSELLEVRRQLASERNLGAPMPFLGDAIERLFEEYPSTTNGLSRTADNMLEALDAAPLAGGDLFQRAQAREPRMFLGDSSFFLMIREMARARVPLIDLAGADHSGGGGLQVAARSISITDAGRAVWRGQLDAVRLNGLDVWRGGVHLSGDAADWRWDPARKTLISCK